MRNLYRRLKADGFEPWLDEEELLPGQDWQEEIPAAIRACDAVVVCLSRQSVTKEGYLQREISYGVSVAEEKPEGTIFMIPVCLEEVEIPRRLNRWQWANLFREDGYKRLVRALKVRSSAIGASVSPSLVISVQHEEEKAERERLDRENAEAIRRAAEAAADEWERLRGEKVEAQRVGDKKERTLKGHTGVVNAVTVTPDGHQAVSASGDGTLKVWDLSSGEEVRTLTGHTGWLLKSVNAVALTPDGLQAISGSDDGTLRMWDLLSGKELRTLADRTGGVRAVAVTPDGLQAISGSLDGALRVWDLTSGCCLRTLVLDAFWNWQCHAVAVTPDGRKAISGSAGKTLKVWDLASGKETRKLTGHASWVVAVAVTPDGLQGISGSQDKTLKVWDLSSGKELRTFTGHLGPVRAVAVTPDGAQAVSASDDQTLKVWDLSSGKELRTLTGHLGPVRAVAVTPDGLQAISGSDDQTLKVWSLTSGAR